MDKRVVLLFLRDIFFEETEDEEEELVLGRITFGILKEKEERHKILNYFEETIPQYLCDDFKSHFRMKRSTIEYIIVNLPNMTKEAGRTALKIEKQILITIWYLGNQEVFRSIADRFDVSKSTAWHVIYRIIDGLIAICQTFIKWPTREEAEQTSETFRKKNGFPNIIGCIDGSHIPILTPQVHGDSYVNRKGYHSMVLQGICNEKIQFINVSCGWPGSMHDSRVLRRTDFGEKLAYNPAELFYGDTHILGDSAYSLTQYILTPYRDNGHLTQQQKNFNRKLSSIRIIIEHAFGLLKTRFRILKFINILNTVNIPKVILACCILHNICMNENDILEWDQEAFENHPNHIEVQQEYQDENSGVTKRNYISSII